MALLEELNAEGHTIIIVTHDTTVAEHADRIIEIRDGEIVADRRGARRQLAARPRCEPLRGSPQLARGARSHARSLPHGAAGDASARLRTFLTMLGIIIGIASVVSVVALGAGQRSSRCCENISAIGTNTINIFPGAGFGDRARATRSARSCRADADALAPSSPMRRQRHAARVHATRTLASATSSANAQVNGVGDAVFPGQRHAASRGRLLQRGRASISWRRRP